MNDIYWQLWMAKLASPALWVVFAFGLIIGSFLNVCIYRIPEGTFFAKSRSHCRHCDAKIPFFYNLPVIGWLLLRGKTACCDKPLSVQYPLVELGTAILFAAVYLRYPFYGDLGGKALWAPSDFLHFSHNIVLISLLITCSVIDLRHMIIPDVISLPMIAMTPLIVWLHPTLKWEDAGLGVLLGGGVIYAIAWTYYLIRKEEGMGMGDAKLLAALGGWLGVQAVLPTIFYASITGSIIGILIILISQKKSGMKTAIPFGPFLALGAILHMLLGYKLQEWMIGGYL